MESRRSAAHAPLLACLLVVTASLTAGAGIVHVPVDQPTIGAGIAAASPGDTVLIACDTYHEHGLVISKQITLAGASTSSVCVTIDGDDVDRVLTVDTADGVVLSDIHFTNGLSNYGGAVRVNDADIELRRCAFSSSHCTGEGGGLACYSCDVQAANCAFLGNTAEEGSGGAMLDDVTGLFYECAFSGNHANWGGGVSMYDSESTVTFDNCTFTNNYADGEESYGGAVYCYRDPSPTFTGCAFNVNASDFCGGAVCLDANAAAVFNDCDFEGNTAVHVGGFYVYLCGAGGFDGCTFVSNVADSAGGGGLLELAGGVSLTNSTFSGNEAFVGGGLNVYQTTGGPVDCTFCENTAFYGGAIAYGDCISGWATGCTMVRNRVEGRQAHGAGVAMGGPFNVALERCIIAFSTAGEAAIGFFGTVTATECDVHGNPGGDWVEALAGQESSNDNTGADPCICDILAPDLTLCADSPCLPGNNVPGVQIGAHGEGCEACGSAVETTTWGAVKARFR